MEPPLDTPGRIIFLNGTSSSGKSTIAEQLLPLLDGPYFHMAVDAFGAMRARESTARLGAAELDLTLARTRAGFHRAAAGMAAAGNDIVVDHVLSEPWRLRDCLVVLAGFDVLFVGVHCAPEELRRRELARGDRAPGQAAAQLSQVHAHGTYDIECDTTATPPYECALRIIAAIAEPTAPSAFDRLRAELFG